MAIRSYKPTTPGRRQGSVSDFAELTDPKKKPEKSLLRPKPKKGGRNHQGIVTARFPQFPALVGDAGGLQTPWLGLFGDLDESIPVDDVEQLRAALDSNANVAHEIVRYADAGHGFHCDQRPEYVPAAAKDAFQRTLDWFERHLK